MCLEIRKKNQHAVAKVQGWTTPIGSDGRGQISAVEQIGQIQVAPS